MERNQIIREDFPTVRKGWDPEAVRLHLRSVAESVSLGSASTEAPAGATLGDVAAGRVRSVLEAAEKAAGEIQSSARSDADGERSAARSESEQALSSARAESERILAAAREAADERVTDAKAAIEGLVEQATALRSQVADLGERLAAVAPSAAPTPFAEVPGPVVVPEPTPPTVPEPTPPTIPEPTPDPVPEPAPAPPAAAAARTTEDLIAQLRAAPAKPPAANGSNAAPAVSGSGLGAARLVAMNLALDGSSREQISAQIEAEFGQVPDLDGLLDEVLARAER